MDTSSLVHDFPAALCVVLGAVLNRQDVMRLDVCGIPFTTREQCPCDIGYVRETSRPCDVISFLRTLTAILFLRLFWFPPMLVYC